MGIVSISFCTYKLWKWIIAKRKARRTKENGMLLLNKEESHKKFSSDNQKQVQELPLFNFEMLVNATSNFHLSNKLGQGGFGPVYMGKMSDGQEIAVKRLSRTSAQGLEEFMNEVVVISKLQHRNLVRLLGCCVEGEERMLLYEYMPNKSLDAFLFDPHKERLLDWKKRFNIIEGIGRGLLYLHRDSRLRIIHRDLKASNILLDKELNPKISDFGMARIFGSNEDQANTNRVVGTYGYMSPEYAMEGRFSEKSDVFSFGVLLLEIVSGRRNSSFYNDEQSQSLLGLAWKLWNTNNAIALIDTMIYEPCFEIEILRCIQVGLLCVQEFAQDRPTVSDVVSMLKSEIVHPPLPMKPAFIERQIASDTDSSQRSQTECSVNNVTVTMVQGR
ncbi:G-type lectin S-receptor-like serine/threonine-protein kinase SD1-13 [Quercus robur]|uniref:G-type lectin S-receptor-like serine/threonine-protein kinase SD1-13 n=1 Tax=Quercus robur TaxID=38942 RepID=UPI0021612B4B|nr:G-type lectin S-receptor-like serine/threonine-protein kinase SD1-13 [Quercus robur]